MVCTKDATMASKHMKVSQSCPNCFTDTNNICQGSDFSKIIAIYIHLYVGVICHAIYLNNDFFFFFLS